MKPEFLESAEFYHRRYHNFSSRVIVPMSLLLVFLFGFAVFAEKEISLSTRATIEPSRIISNIQSTSNQRIVANYLEENKLVKQGDLLVQYQQGAEAVQAEAYASQLDMLKDQKKQLEYLQKSLQEGENHFPEEDKFGYQEMFRDYLSQASSLRSNVSQQNANISSQNAAASQTQAEIGNLISQTEAKIRDYQTAKSAIETGDQLDSQNVAYSFYQTYKNQGAEDPRAKSQVIAQVDAQIAQLESGLATYRVQYAGSGAQQAYASGLDSQLESLKSQHLVKVGQELTLLDQKILEAESGKKVQGGLLDKGKIIASEDGVLHLNPETSDSTMVAEGTLLAQLYPALEREGKTKLTAYLSSKDVARLKVGDSVRFTTSKDANKELVLVSAITNIDATATKTEKGNFFKIEAETSLTPEQAEQLRYGVEGRLQMITGRKSYLRYYLDQFLNQE
ncbi:competence pheromone export protein ComB [Streptococcus oralis]|uniref:competence pheromone export protein ComB n=1 Tax=Streptococcus oralis TaxID=1303 RepID=UPI0005F1161B|nr:competence pheromone export protein ComB [Streptococcus oralis]KJQ78032.1 competence factor transport protein ComB [Streptococcus oralis subsp. tigurinus]MCY7113000.1 competence pheromone export protein ComB [Streptococcus oralis]